MEVICYKIRLQQVGVSLLNNEEIMKQIHFERGKKIKMVHQLEVCKFIKLPYWMRYVGATHNEFAA